MKFLHETSIEFERQWRIVKGQSLGKGVVASDRMVGAKALLRAIEWWNGARWQWWNGGDSVESRCCGIVGGWCCVSETGAMAP